jgi:hypothetical protein
MNDLQFWALIVSVAAAVGGLLVAVFSMGRFTGRMERGLVAVGEGIANLDAKIEAQAEASAAAHIELGKRVDRVDDRIVAHLQATAQMGD